LVGLLIVWLGLLIEGDGKDRWSLILITTQHFNTLKTLQS
jgi:hypothetical protein